MSDGTMLLLIIFFAVFIGAFIQGATGLGLGLVITAILPFFLTVKETTLLVISLLIISGLTVTCKYYKHLVWKEILGFLVVVLVGRFVAFFILSAYGDMDFLKIWLGVVLLLIVIYQLLSAKKMDTIVELSPRRKNVSQIGLGFTAGLIGGVFGLGGPFIVLYFLLFYPQKKFSYIVSVQAVTTVASLFSISIHAVNGDFYPSFFTYFLIGLVAVILGTNLGLRLFEKVNATIVKRITIVLITVSAITIILFA
nr:sulfite exporter TauE/SafE family protein [Alkalicoccobacillus plakortidis]